MPLEIFDSPQAPVKPEGGDAPKKHPWAEVSDAARQGKMPSGETIGTAAKRAGKVAIGMEDPASFDEAALAVATQTGPVGLAGKAAKAAVAGRAAIPGALRGAAPVAGRLAAEGALGGLETPSEDESKLGRIAKRIGGGLVGEGAGKVLRLPSEAVKRGTDELVKRLGRNAAGHFASTKILVPTLSRQPLPVTEVADLLIKTRQPLQRAAMKEAMGALHAVDPSGALGVILEDAVKGGRVLGHHVPGQGLARRGAMTLDPGMRTAQPMVDAALGQPGARDVAMGAVASLPGAATGLLPHGIRRILPSSGESD